MKTIDEAPFDPEIYLAKIGKGRTISDFRRNHTVFLQGDAADSIFYIQKGKVKLTVVSKQGKEAVAFGVSASRSSRSSSRSAGSRRRGPNS